MLKVDRFVTAQGYAYVEDFAPDEIEPSSAVPLASLLTRKASLVLGEPGSGKTTALAGLVEVAQSTMTAKLLDLRDYGSEFTLSAAFDALDLIADVSDEHVLLLDSIDETRLVLRDFVRFIERRLLPLFRSGWRVVAACRTAESVSALHGVFDSMEKNAVHVLLPLRRLDVISLADARQVDGKAFLEQIESHRIRSLAATPYSLTHLLDIFANDGKLPDSRQTLFERAVALMLANDSVGGYTPRQAEPQDPIRQRAAVNRLAGYAALTDAESFAQFNIGERPLGTQTERLTGMEVIDDLRFDLNNSDLQAVLWTPVFADSGTEGRQFAHRRLRDFLAANHLAGADFSIPQLKSLLLVEDGDAIPPQMADVATWLVILRPEAFSWLLQADPLTLVRNRLTTEQPSSARELVHGLMGRAEEVYRTLSWSDELSGLNYVDMESDFRAYLDGSVEQQFLALRILRDSYTPALDETLKKIVESRTQPIRMRQLAADVLRANDVVPILEQLAWHEPGFFDGDENAELRGTVFSALWPAYVSADELTPALTEPPEGFFGAYSIFLSRLADSMTPALARALAERAAARTTSVAPGSAPWIADDSLDRLTSQAVGMLLSDPTTDPGTVKVVAPVVARQIYDGRAKLPFSRANVSDATFQVLIEEVVGLGGGKFPVWYGLLTARDADDQRLITRSDLEWIAEQARKLPEPMVDVWARVADQLLDSTNDEDMRWAWNERGGPLWRMLAYRFDAIDIDSEVAEQARKSLALTKQLEREPQAAALSSEEYIRTIRSIIQDVRVHPLRFWHLARWLDVDLVSRRYKHDFQPDLLSLENIKLLEEKDQAEILALAQAYVEAASGPERPYPDRPKRNAFYPGLQAVYQALYTLHQHAPESLGDVSAGAWVAANIAILESMRGSDEVRGDLLLRSAAVDTAAVSAAVDAFLARIARGTSHGSGLGAAKSVIAPSNVSALRNAIRKSDHHRGQLAGMYLDLDVVNAREWLRKRVMRSTDETEVASLVGSLLEADPFTGYATLLDFCDRDESITRAVLLRVAQHERYGRERIREVEPELRVKVFVRLATLFPPAEDSIPTGFHTVTPREDLARWRSDLVGSVASSGSPEGLRALRSAAKSNPHIDLEYAIAAAREAYRVNGWAPLAARDYAALLASRARQIARSAGDVQVAVVEALEMIQGWLRNETPQAFALWNVGPKFSNPKDENRISDWYCHALRVILDRGGLVINREVEVKRVADAGVGRRQDIRIEVRNPSTGELFVVVVEVKGIWNRDVRSSLSSQLAHDYLVGGGLTHGVYLVVDFDSSQMTHVTKIRQANRNRPNLLEHLEQQASLEAPALRIKPVVHDASLPT